MLRFGKVCRHRRLCGNACLCMYVSELLWGRLSCTTSSVLCSCTTAVAADSVLLLQHLGVCKLVWQAAKVLQKSPLGFCLSVVLHFQAERSAVQCAVKLECVFGPPCFHPSSLP